MNADTTVSSPAAIPRVGFPRGLTILVPTLNEEDAIGGVIGSLPVQDLHAMGIDTHVLVVDGHSADRTRDIAARAGAEVVVQPGKGKGDGIRHGLRHASGDLVLAIDADGSYPSEAIPVLVRRLADGCDVVVGTRIRGGMEPGAMPPMNYIGNRFLSLLATALFGVRITDLCSGMWGLGPRAVALIRLESNGFDIEPEVIAESCRLKLRVEEVPIAYRVRKGATKLGNPLRAGVGDALRLVTVRFRRARSS